MSFNPTSVREASLSDAVWVTTGRKGPYVVIFGGMHGNEPCGLDAVRQLLFDFTSGRRSLTHGSVLLVEANRQASRTRERFLTHNLNRLLTDDPPDEQIDQQSYEYRRAQELKTALNGPSHFLDIHSLSSDSPPFFVCNAENAPFFRGLGAGAVLIGWETLAGPLGGTASSYAGNRGVVAATYEAGLNGTYVAQRQAYHAAVRFLAATGVMDAGDDDFAHTEGPADLYEFCGVYLKRSVTCRYIRETRPFMRIEEGEKLVQDGIGATTVPPGNVLVMPVDYPSKVEVGNEVYFTARQLR